MKAFLKFLKGFILAELFHCYFEDLSDLIHFLTDLREYKQKEIDKIDILIQSTIDPEQKEKLEWEKYLLMLYKSKINILLNKCEKLK